MNAHIVAMVALVAHATSTRPDAFHNTKPTTLGGKQLDHEGTEENCADVMKDVLADQDKLAALLGMPGHYKKIILGEDGKESIWVNLIRYDISSVCNRNAKMAYLFFTGLNLTLLNDVAPLGSLETILPRDTGTKTGEQIKQAMESAAGGKRSVALCRQRYFGEYEHWFTIEHKHNQGFRFYQGSKFLNLTMKYWLGGNRNTEQISTDLTHSKQLYGNGQWFSGEKANSFFRQLNDVTNFFKENDGVKLENSGDTQNAFAAYKDLFGHQPGEGAVSRASGSLQALVKRVAANDKCTKTREAFESYMTNTWRKCNAQICFGKKKSNCLDDLCRYERPQKCKDSAPKSAADHYKECRTWLYSKSIFNDEGKNDGVH